MSYFSLEFSIMMIVFFAVYWAFRERYLTQNVLVLCFSYLIYILINPYFALVLFVYTFFIHYFALLIRASKKEHFYGLFGFCDFKFMLF